MELSIINKCMFTEHKKPKDVHNNLKELEFQCKLPIEYNDSKKTLDNKVVENIEFVKQNEILYGKTTLGTHAKALSTLYTTDTEFLKCSQQFLKNFEPEVKDLNIDIHSSQEFADTFYKQWKSQMLNPNIRDTYYYLEWDHVDFLNYNPKFMLFLGLYQLSSPITTLLTPFILFIVPFFILKYGTSTPITAKTYIQALSKYSGKNPLGRCITLLTSQDCDINQTISGISMLVIFLTTVYQSILMCYRFYQNMHKMKHYIQNTRKLFTQSLKYIELLNEIITKYDLKHGYDIFFDELQLRKCIYQKELDDISSIKDSTFGILNILQIGTYMSTFYHYRNNDTTQKLFQYAFELHELVFHYFNISKKIQTKMIEPCSFHSSTKMIKSYHPSLIQERNDIHNTIVKNDVSLHKNMVVTGPNASGKTTLIKNVLLNSILSQQIGHGCYDSTSRVKIYDNFFSYLNIPDTCERDSLFQAEARRCLEIIKSIESISNEKKSSLMIFDELYSGTNPSEASISAIAFIQHIMKYKVSFLITTHYYDICKTTLLDKTKLQNVHMETHKHNTYDLEYTYKLEKGPCYTHGGFVILKDMNYPQEIINSIHEIELSLYKKKMQNKKHKISHTKQDITNSIRIKEKQLLSNISI